MIVLNCPASPVYYTFRQTQVKNMPWYIVLTGSIIIILFGIYKKLNVGLTMLLGALALGLLSGLPAKAFFEVLVSGLWNSITIMLIISILLLGVLGHILKATGAMEEMIVNLHVLVFDVRIISAAIPMLIGMLTVPGGAILSAPLCAEAGKQLNISPERLTAINIWFRHVLYFMLPLFPSLIIAAELSGVGISRLVLHNLPLTIIGLVFGFLWLFKGYPVAPKASKKTVDFSGGQVWSLLKSILPLLIIFSLVVFSNLYFPLALLAGIITALLNYLPRGEWGNELFGRLRTMIVPGLKISLALVIAGIMLFKEMLNRTGVIIELTDIILTMGIPVIILIIFVPFLVGMLTGDNTASVAILFPVFITLLPAAETSYSAYAAFLFACSTAGHIVSPAHPCFSLTREYYQANINKVILLLVPLLTAVVISGFLLTLLYEYY